MTTSPGHSDAQGSRPPWLLPLLGVAALWALYVAVRFARLPEVNLPQLIQALDQRLPSLLVAIAAAGAAGFLTGLLLSSVFRGGDAATWKAALGLPLLLALGAISIYLTKRMLVEWSDGPRVVALALLAAIVGAGFSVGVRLSGHPLHRGLFALLLALPVLTVAVIGRELLTLAACLAILLIAHAAGGWVLVGIRAIRSEEERLDSEPIVTVGLGLIALTAVTLALGLAGAATRTGLLLLLAASSLFALRTLPSTAGRIRRLLNGPALRPSPVFAASAFVLATLLAIYLVAAVAPEVGVDGVGFRVATPAGFVASGRFSPQPFSVWSYGVIGGDVLYALFLPLFAYSVAKIVSLLLAATLFISLSVRFLGGEGFAAGGPWLLAFFSSTMVWCQFAWGFADITQLFFYFGSIAAVRFWMADRNRTGWLFVAGLLGGMATAVKMNGASSVVITASIAFFLTGRKERDMVRAFRNAGVTVAGAAIVLAPFFLRSWWYTRNPVFPIANRIFLSELASPDLQKVTYGIGLKWPDVLTVPWQLFFRPSTFAEAVAYNPALLASAGLVLAFLVLGRKATGIWFTAAALAGLAWLVTEQGSRYMLFVALFFAVGLAVGLRDLAPRLRQGTRAALSAVSLVVVLLGFAGHVAHASFWPGRERSGAFFPVDVLGRPVDREAYLTTRVLTYRTARFVNETLGPSASVAQLNVRDHLYFRFPTFSWPHSIWPVTRLLAEAYLDSLPPEVILDGLKTYGVTHILVHMDSLPFAKTADSKRTGLFAPGFVARRLRLEFADRGLRLYRLLKADRDEQDFPVWTSTDLLALASATPTPPPSDIDVSVPVQGGQLYRIALERVPASAPGVGQLRVTWFDSSHRLLASEGHDVPERLDGVEYETFQTAPAGAMAALVQTWNFPLRAARIGPDGQ